MKNAVLPKGMPLGISELFSEMADIMEILGEDRFRINPPWRRRSHGLFPICRDVPFSSCCADTAGSAAKIRSWAKSKLKA